MRKRIKEGKGKPIDILNGYVVAVRGSDWVLGICLLLFVFAKSDAEDKTRNVPHVHKAEEVICLDEERI